MTWFWIVLSIFAVLLILGAAAGANTELPKADEVDHIPPGWHTSRHGWERIRICNSCGARGGHWDHMFCVRPCSSCGADSYCSHETSGKWNEEKKQWWTRTEIQTSEREEEQANGND